MKDHLEKGEAMIQTGVVGIDFGAVFNYLLTGFGFVISLIVKTIWDDIKEVKVEQRNIKDELAEIRVLVAGDYVKNERLDAVINAVFRKLDKIEEKLNSRIQQGPGNTR